MITLSRCGRSHSNVHVSNIPKLKNFVFCDDRDILVVVLGVYFIVFNKKAEDRMHRFHNQAAGEDGIKGIRACWSKGHHPLLWRITKFKEKSRFWINIHRRHIVIDPVAILQLDKSDENLCPIDVYLYFQGTEEELSRAQQLVINYPGGGFVTMNHLHHESYVQKWTNYRLVLTISSAV